jgi:outer membrane protein
MRHGLRVLLGAAACLLAPAAQAQTLTEALSQAYNNNPTLLAARAQLRATDEGVPQALAGWRPTVSLAGAYGAADTRARTQVQALDANNRIFFRDPQPPSSTTSRQERSPASATATLSQPLFRGGRTVSQTRQAENLVLAQRAG